MARGIRKGKTTRSGVNWYTDKMKMEVLKMVELTGNMSKVSRETGVSRQTIMSWMKTTGSKITTPVGIKTIEKNVTKRIEKKEEDFVVKVFEAKQCALEKMKALIEKSDNLRSVTQAFAVLHSVGIGVNGNLDLMNSKESATNIQNNFIQKIYQLQGGKGVNTNSNGKTTIKIDGNSEE